MSTSRRSRLSIWWWEISYRVGPNLWVVPLVMSVASLLLFAVTRWMDHHLLGLQRWLPEILVADSPTDATIVLTALLGAIATTLALVFSTGILSFSIASSQLGPRLIRRFMRDSTTQTTLGALLATLIFIVLTLSSVRSGLAEVPRFSIAAAVLMSLGCFALLVYYVHRVASMIQAPNVVAAVVQDLDDVLVEVDHYLPDVVRSDVQAARDATAQAHAVGGQVASIRSGYVELVDHPRLLGAAEDASALIVLEHRPGQFVVEGAVLARVVPAEAVERVRTAIDEAVEIGRARTLRQDLEFAVAQVTEIALRALSPAVNDTYTGLTCVDWLGAAMVEMGRHRERSGGFCSDGGQLRLVLPELRFERTLKAAFDLIRQAGARNPAVLIRMLDAFESMVPLVRPEHLVPLERQAELVVETAMSAGFVSGDQADVTERYERVRAALAARR